LKTKPKLLIVEDEPLIRRCLAEAFEEAGYAILESSTGEDAIAELEEADIAAVLTDIRLGAGVNGWDVARSARLQHPHMAVVYMTGDSAGDWVKEGVPTSVLLQKPFAMAQMITAVCSLLNPVDLLSR
jgi:DNA-binding response OmpR family regulator